MTKKPLNIKGDSNSRARLGVGTEDGAVTATLVEVQKEIRDDIIYRKRLFTSGS